MRERSKVKSRSSISSDDAEWKAALDRAAGTGVYATAPRPYKLAISRPSGSVTFKRRKMFDPFLAR
jgi:hypothetical protein